MFKGDSGKNKKPTSNLKKTFQKHRRSHSNISVAETFPDFGEFNDTQINSSDNSTTSLTRLGQTPLMGTSNKSLESLQSAPELRPHLHTRSRSFNGINSLSPKFSFPNKPNLPNPAKLKSGISKKSNKNRIKSTSLIESSTILEDDETEMNFPMLPEFSFGGERKDIPMPKEKTSGGDLSAESGTESLENERQDVKMMRSSIDADFDFNFSKDATVPRGQQILRSRKRNPPVHKKVVMSMGSSSDDDASTENETDSENENENGNTRNPFFSKSSGDQESVKSQESPSKSGIRSFFRKRGLSLSSKSVPRSEQTHSSNTSNDSTDNKEKSSVNDIAMERLSSSPPINEHTLNDSTDIHFSDEKAGHDNTDNDSANDTTVKNEGAYEDENYQTHDDTGSFQVDDDNNGIGNTNSENFFKNIFHMDGLLGQGGLIPHQNVSQNTIKRGDTIHDEENPPPDFEEEIRGEAKVLVDHMIRSPLENLKKISFKNSRKRNASQSSNNDGAAGNDTDNTGDSGIYVPEGAHLPLDPFDDLQNIEQFSIDVPENVIEKPKKIRAGIQSTLFQLYNTHLMGTNSTATSLSGDNASTLVNEKPMHESFFLESRPEHNNLNMNLGEEIERTGIAGHPLGNVDFLDEMPDLERIKDEETENFKSFHKKTASLQEKFFHVDPKKPANSSKKKSDVKFELPNFSSKPKSAATSGSEIKTHLGNLKKRRFNKMVNKETKARITVHITDVLERQRFILTLCKAFMLYGAPTHRLEEYMSMTAQVLEIDGSFIYFPGCMLVSFGDLNARTSEMKLVRCAQGLDLGKLDEVHDVYKDVVHDRLGAVEGYQVLDKILTRKPKFNKWWCILFYALSSLAVAPWSFGGSWIDLPMCFAIGGIIGFLQFVVCPKNTLYSSVFEVTSSIIASFLARAFGSINSGNTFCYAALVQSPLALILPGYIILCGSLELQSRNIVAGSVRMFYAFIYSLMLSFGITLGAALYGWIDHNATSATTCTTNISPWYRFLFVPMFTIGIALTNQASWSQLPMMCIISGCGYVVSYFASTHFKEVTELNATLGCFIIGLVSNIYSRSIKTINHYLKLRGSFMTVALMLPAIFVQVPSGIASQGSVFTGITAANNIVHSDNQTEASQTNSLSFGMVMIQVALGISVGLYLSTIIVYPFGKKRTGLFTL